MVFKHRTYKEWPICKSSCQRTHGMTSLHTFGNKMPSDLRAKQNNHTFDLFQHCKMLRRKQFVCAYSKHITLKDIQFHFLERGDIGQSHACSSAWITQSFRLENFQVIILSLLFTFPSLRGYHSRTSCHAVLWFPWAEKGTHPRIHLEHTKTRRAEDRQKKNQLQICHLVLRLPA